MSAEAVAWVYRHSPMKGSALLVHLAIADTANDQHEYRFWMRQKKLAVKARTSRASTQRALEDLAAAGLLTKVGERPNGLIEYQFHMPALPLVYDAGEAGGVPHGEAPRPHGEAGGVPHGEAHEPKCSEPKKNLTLLSNEGSFDGGEFDAFWRAYPRRVAKGTAVKAWAKARKLAPAEVIVAGVERYARSVKGKEPQYIAHPASWLNAQRWLDEAEASTPSRAPHSANIDTDRSKPSGVIDLRKTK